jgi:hypothetical protein
MIAGGFKPISTGLQPARKMMVRVRGPKPVTMQSNTVPRAK